MRKLVTARDIAERDGLGSVTEWFRAKSLEAERKSVISRAWDGRSVSGTPMLAFVDFGRWIGKCECGGYCYVDPDEPIAFCLRCGNQGSGMARPVLFPGEMIQIEEALLARPVVDDPRAHDRVEKARLGRPVVDGLIRNWYPGQGLENLLAENERLLQGGK